MKVSYYHAVLNGATPLHQVALYPCSNVVFQLSWHSLVLTTATSTWDCDPVPLLQSYRLGSTCLPSPFLGYRPTETCAAVPSVTYTVRPSAHKWLPQISDNPDETVYHISLLFKRIPRQGQCDLLFILLKPPYPSLAMNMLKINYLFRSSKRR